MVSIILALLVGTSLAQDPCPDPRQSMRRAATAIFQTMLADGEGLLLEAERGFACREMPATPEEVAQFHLAWAARYFMVGKDTERDLHYAAAREASTMTFDQNLGDDQRAIWENARQSGEGMLILSGLPAGWVVWVDGTETDISETVIGGPHLVQAGPDRRTAVWADLISVTDGGEARVSLPPELVGQFAAEATPTSSSPTPTTAEVSDSVKVVKKKRGKGGLIAGLTLAGVGAGTAVGTWLAAYNVDQGSPAGNVLLAGNTAGWGLAGVGGGITVISLATGGKKGAVVGAGPRQLTLTGRF
jgi:hypothetical protein